MPYKIKGILSKNDIDLANKATKFKILIKKIIF